MAIDLLTRSEKGSPLTALEHDTNLDAIEGAVNANSTSISDLISSLATLDTDSAKTADFEGLVGGKQTIDWVNVVNKPVGNYVFCAKKSIADQLVAGGSSAVIEMDAEDFDPASIFDSNTFIAPVAGYYQFNWSTQVELVSGSPTGIAITVTLRVNGSPVEQAVLDLADNTGTRIYKGGRLLSLTIGQVVDLHIDIAQTGTADWKVSANGDNTFLSGFLVAAST